MSWIFELSNITEFMLWQMKLTCTGTGILIGLIGCRIPVIIQPPWFVRRGSSHGSPEHVAVANHWLERLHEPSCSNRTSSFLRVESWSLESTSPEDLMRFLTDSTSHDSRRKNRTFDPIWLLFILEINFLHGIWLVVLYRANIWRMLKLRHEWIAGYRT